MYLTHGQTGTRTYQSWKDMRRRCEQPKFKQWKDYGGRGISVCARWQKFENFHADMGTAPSNATIDRINNHGNYEPGNCRWATRKEQASHRRPHGIRSNNTSGFPGVVFNLGRWQASVHKGGKRIHLGRFDTAVEAATARKEYIE